MTCTPSTRRPLDGVAVPHPIHGLICAQAPTDEDSIPWKQALELIEAKKVKSVEFNDVAMDKCWVVTSDGRFRVGEGYPIEDGRSWSSPLFVTRILDNNQIPRTYVGGLKRKSR